MRATPHTHRLGWLISSLSVAAACGGRSNHDTPALDPAAASGSASAGKPESTPTEAGKSGTIDAGGARSSGGANVPEPTTGATIGVATGGAQATGGIPARGDAGADDDWSGGGAAGAGDGGEAGNSGNACSHTTWTATGSCIAAPEFMSFCQPGSLAVDGNPLTRFTTGAWQVGTEEFAVTFPSTVTLSGIELTSIAYGLENDGPAIFEVESSADGATFAPFAPPLTGSGAATLTITFPATRMKAVKVKQTGMKDWWWSIREFEGIGCRTD